MVSSLMRKGATFPLVAHFLCAEGRQIIDGDKRVHIHR